MSDDKFIRLTYTLEEWQLLEKLAKKKGANCLRDHFVNRLHLITKNYVAGNSMVLSTKRLMTQRIPLDLYVKISEIAELRQTSLASVTSWLVMEPLLREHYDNHIFKLR